MFSHPCKVIPAKFVLGQYQNKCLLYGDRLPLDYLRNACVCLSVCHRPFRDCHLRFVAIREKIVACEAREGVGGRRRAAAAAAFFSRGGARSERVLLEAVSVIPVHNLFNINKDN